MTKKVKPNLAWPLVNPNFKTKGSSRHDKNMTIELSNNQNNNCYHVSGQATGPMREKSISR